MQISPKTNRRSSLAGKLSGDRSLYLAKAMYQTLSSVSLTPDQMQVQIAYSTKIEFLLSQHLLKSDRLYLEKLQKQTTEIATFQQKAIDAIWASVGGAA